MEEQPLSSPVKKVRRIKDIKATTLGAPIEGRITKKLDKFRDGPRQLFNFVIRDATAEIGALVDGDLVDEWYDSIETDKCYRISNYGTTKCKERHKRTRHECEILILKITKIQEIDGADIPWTWKRQKKSILEIGKEEAKKMVSLVAIVFEVKSSCRNREGKPTQRVVLVDDSLRVVTVTLSGTLVDQLNEKEGTCIVLENVLTQNYKSERVLETGSYSRMKTNNDEPIPEQRELQYWWDDDGQDEEFEKLVIATA